MSLVSAFFLEHGVCLSARISQKVARLYFTKFPRHVTDGRGLVAWSCSDGSAIHILPVVWMTSCLHIME